MVTSSTSTLFTPDYTDVLAHVSSQNTQTAPEEAYGPNVANDAAEALEQMHQHADSQEAARRSLVRFNLDSAVQEACAMQDPELESLLMGAEHSPKVKAAPIKSDSGSGDCVDLASSTAESRFNKLVSGARGMIPKERVEQILKETGYTLDEVLQKLLPIAQEYSKPAISKFRVGAVAIGKTTGALFFGGNLEFIGVPLTTCVHAEQFLIVHARKHGEQGFEKIAITASPCGHCRQFMNEIGESATFDICTPNNLPTKLAELLPQSFGPHDLGFKGGLLTTPSSQASVLSPDPSLNCATEAAELSYAPTTNSPSGVAIRMKNGTHYSGSYLENVAFNPSVSPFQAALVQLVADGASYSDIAEVVLVEKSIKDGAMISYASEIAAIMKHIGPEAPLRIVDF